MTGEGLAAALAEAGSPWPAAIEELDVVTSTNDVVREHARAGAPEWTAVLARRQTGGRGRLGRPWASPEGNLYVSVLLRPPLPLDRWTVLPLMAGVAVAEAAEALGAEARLKWPNDVLVDGRKLAGILVDASSGTSGLEFAVVGIGVNVARVPLDLPEEARAGATSLLDVLGREVTVREAAAVVLRRLAGCYDRLRHEGAGAVRDAWRARSVPWWGRTVEARSGGVRLVGVARDVDDHGALILETADGGRTILHSGEVREVRASPLD